MLQSIKDPCSIVLKPDGSTRPIRGWNRLGWRKNRRRKNPVWPSDPIRPGQKPVATRWLLFFLLKWRRFDLKKIDPSDPVKTQWPSQNPEPGPWTGQGLKTMPCRTKKFPNQVITSLQEMDLCEIESWQVKISTTCYDIYRKAFLNFDSPKILP